MPLRWATRDVIGLTISKFIGGIAQHCVSLVHLGDNPVNSFLYPAAQLGDRNGQRRESGRGEGDILIIGTLG